LRDIFKLQALSIYILLDGLYYLEIFLTQKNNICANETHVTNYSNLNMLLNDKIWILT